MSGSEGLETDPEVSRTGGGRDIGLSEADVRLSIETDGTGEQTQVFGVI